MIKYYLINLKLIQKNINTDKEVRMFVNKSKKIGFEIAEQLKNEFPKSAIGLIGCYSSREFYFACEYDFLIIQEGTKKIERRLINNNFVEIIFINKKSVQNINNFKMIFAFLDMNVISDPHWDLIPTVASIKSESSKHLSKYAKQSLFESLSNIGRFNDAINVNNLLDAGFWLLNSANIFASAIIALNGKIPRNSHILQEFRKNIPNSLNIFELWSEVEGLNFATTVSVTRRLDAIREVLKIGSIFSDSNIFSQHEYAYLIIEAKSNYLVKTHSVLDAYCYLGLELTKSIEKLYELQCQKKGNAPLFHEMIKQLNIQENSLKKISTQTIRLIGINADEQMLRSQGSRFSKLIKTVIKKYPK